MLCVIVTLHIMCASPKLVSLLPFTEPHLFQPLCLRSHCFYSLMPSYLSPLIHSLPILQGSTPASSPPGLPSAHGQLEYPSFFSPSCAISPVMLPVQESLDLSPTQAGTTSSFFSALPRSDKLRAGHKEMPVNVCCVRLKAQSAVLICSAFLGFAGRQTLPFLTSSTCTP